MLLAAGRVAEQAKSRPWSGPSAESAVAGLSHGRVPSTPWRRSSANAAGGLWVTQTVGLRRTILGVHPVRSHRSPGACMAADDSDGAGDLRPFDELLEIQQLGSTNRSDSATRQPLYDSQTLNSSLPLCCRSQPSFQFPAGRVCRSSGQPPWSGSLAARTLA